MHRPEQSSAIYLLIILTLSMVAIAGCTPGNTSGSNTITTIPPSSSPTSLPPASSSPTSLPPASSSPTPSSPTPSPAEPTSSSIALDDIQLDLQPVEGTFQLPLYVTYAGDGSGRIFVVEKEGTVSIVRQNRRQSSFFLDIRDRVGASASEQGLLSIAFHPDYAENGQFFVNYTDTNGDTVVARYHVSSNPDVADAASEEVILTIEQPAANHNGGLVLFGPDGYLYIGMGDGGAAGDPWGNAQDRSVLLGNMLRLDVDQGSPYAIPPDNPFVDQANMRPEIWAWGLRNPWRFSFDRATNDLYIGDVGQNMYEEVHYQPASSDGGENYGWNRMEGAACYPEDGSCETQGLEMPVAVYSHQDGHCSITGGYVYRGIASPELQGVYFFADYCSGYLWALRQVNGNWNSRLVQQTGMSISSFGEDESGELYLTDMWEGKVYRLSSR